MQIQLKQPEIEEALKQYISQQGIILTNKSIVITFTSGRKDNGLTADVEIENLIPVKIEAAPVEESTAPKVAVNLFK